MNIVQHSKSELMDIYNKAKRGEYDLMQLSLKEIELLNNLLEEEIKLKRNTLAKMGIKA